MINRKIWTTLLSALISISIHAQPTNAFTDAEKKYKAAREFFVKEQYALAYPLLKELKELYPDNTKSDHTYLNDDILYFDIVCRLQLMHPVAADDAVAFIASVGNEPRRQIMAYHLAHNYFRKDEFASAIEYFDVAGYDNISNEQIADAKFEKAYAYFNLKQFEQAKPLFNEIHQIPGHKYYVPANYYYGFIAYKDKQYNEALKAFKLVETLDEYQGVVPYYIAEIYYFQGKKDEALRYGESILAKGNSLYYEKQLKLLLGQLYFEKQDFKKALPMLEDYVNSSEKVSKEVLYELSYCYYKEGMTAQAINGFKQLSSERDSMGQNSMYLLGSLYLRVNEKANARNAFQYGAYNNSNPKQQKVSLFNYAKLSYELGYQDIALTEMKNYLAAYPDSEYDTEAKEILVSLLANTNNFREALSLYESFGRPTLSMQKVYPRILYGKAIEYINDQQLQQADELLNKILNDPLAGTVLPYANFWKGEIAYRLQRYDDAIRHLSNYVQANVIAQGEANAVAARYNIGYSWFQKENFRQAAGFFEQIVKNTSANSSAMEQDAYLRTADSYYMLKDFAKAGTMYENVINIGWPQADYAMMQKAMIAGIKSGPEKIRILNNLSRQYPRSSLLQEVNMEIAQTYIADEKFSDAIPYLNNMINATGGDGLKPKALLKLGLAYYNSNDNKKALTTYQQLIRQFPQSAESAEAQGIIRDIYVEEGRPNDYVEFMRQNGMIVSISEADSLTYTASLLKYNANDCTAAVKALTNYLSLYPDGAYSLDAWYFRSECYQRNKDWQHAVEGYVYVSGKGLSKYFEKSTLEAARIYYFEQKDYANAKKYFGSLRENALSQDNILESLRGLVRSHYQLKDYVQANDIAKELVSRKGITTDDRSIGFLVLGKSQQLNNDCNAAIASFSSAASINKSAWGAEARYEIASCYMTLNKTAAAEKAAMAVIKETGSYDYWVTRSYILLGDIFMSQKDYFNAKATFESVARNASIQELKDEARQKLENAIAEEKQKSKISSN